MDTQLRTLQKKRTANFREDETRLLIQLWGSPSIQNKLFLTHRKAPVMRLLAANMQQRGFYRTPDEIKTRIRNLKCLYHRIKRTMACGTGLGIVDPDWPHFKAMDEILSKDYPRKEVAERIMEHLEGTANSDGATTPKIEDIQIKQEVDDIDIDDNDSWATNESANSEYDDDMSPPPPPRKPSPPPLLPTSSAVQSIQPKRPALQATVKLGVPQPHVQKLPTLLPAFSLPTHVNGLNQTHTGVASAAVNKQQQLPFPLLILNSLPQQQQQQNSGDKGMAMQSGVANGPYGAMNRNDSDVTNLLKELIDVQKNSLELQKEKLDVEKQRLEFDRMIGTQMITLIPMLGGLLQRLAYPTSQELLDLNLDTDAGLKRKRAADDSDILKDSKILRSMLEQGIKKYMMIDEEKDSDNDDSGIHNDDRSNCSDRSGDK